MANGHTYFVQHPSAMCVGLRQCAASTPLPFAVHATYQYGDNSAFAFGKRARLEQAGLWRSDGPWQLRVPPPAGAPHGDRRPGSVPWWMSSGSGDEPAERFVVLDEDAIDAEAAAHRDAARATSADANDSRALIRLHRAIDWRWRRRVLSLLALSIALNRTAVLPPAWCYCDAFWGGMRGCRVPAAASMALPFECPLDHIGRCGLQSDRWVRE